MRTKGTSLSSGKCNGTTAEPNIEMFKVGLLGGELVGSGRVGTALVELAGVAEFSVETVRVEESVANELASVAELVLAVVVLDDTGLSEVAPTVPHWPLRA